METKDKEIKANVLKDIKYSIQSPNPHQILNLSVQHWTVIVIYEKNNIKDMNEYERK